MIRLHPVTESVHQCPYCHVTLDVKGWYIPGVRNLADLQCPKCGNKFYGDLLSGHQLFFPMIVDKKTGAVFGQYGNDAFSNWLRDSYATRKSTPINFTVKEFRPLKNIVLLNCIDAYYGHSLLKLLNAQYYLDHCKDRELVVLVPRFLRWMIPEGVAAIWTVDLPLRRGLEWNDWLASEIKSRVEKTDTCMLSVGLSHPHPADFDIGLFTKIKPFNNDRWKETRDSPVITFIWRDDRCWSSEPGLGRIDYAINKMMRKIGLNRERLQQKSRLIKMATLLKEQCPSISFAVIGIGKNGDLPGWIQDMRTSAIDEKTEKEWCARYAKSHVSIGIHGSNMLLPTALSGAIIELMPSERWGNILQDILFRNISGREMLFLNRIVPMSTPPEELVQIIKSILTYHDYSTYQMGDVYSRHNESIFDIHRKKLP